MGCGCTRCTELPPRSVCTHAERLSLAGRRQGSGLGGDRRSRSVRTLSDQTARCNVLHSPQVKGFNYSSSSASLRALRIIGPNTNRAITRMMSHSQITATTQFVGTRRVRSSNQCWASRLGFEYVRRVIFGLLSRLVVEVMVNSSRTASPSRTPRSEAGSSAPSPSPPGTRRPPPASPPSA